MIQLECSNCKTLLSIDDAFAGGVCRCQHCGTIQTVPKPGKDAVAAADGASPKALFKRKARIESALNPYSDSLDRAADELGSSGNLSANALANVGGATRRSSNSEDAGTGQSGTPSPGNGRSGSFAGSPSASRGNTSPPGPGQPSGGNVASASAKPHYTPTPSKSAGSGTAAPAPSLKTPIIIGGVVGLVIVVIGAMVVWLGFSGSKAKPIEHPITTPPVTPPVTAPVSAPTAPVTAPATPDSTQKPSTAETPAQVAAPNAAAELQASICGLPITGDPIIYIMNRSGCTQQTFQQMTDACLKSAETLGGAGRFQVAVWNNYQDLRYPADSLGAASAAEIDSARKTIVNTYAGWADIEAILAKAVALQPAAIVLVSAVDIDQSIAQKIRTALKDKSIKLYGIAAGNDLTGDQLRPLTGELGGSFKQMDLSGQ